MISETQSEYFEKLTIDKIFALVKELGQHVQPDDEEIGKWGSSTFRQGLSFHDSVKY